jgi:hypothetical protein
VATAAAEDTISTLSKEGQPVAEAKVDRGPESEKKFGANPGEPSSDMAGTQSLQDPAGDGKSTVKEQTNSVVERSGATKNDEKTAGAEKASDTAKTEKISATRKSRYPKHG